jgi:hypothetical protein
MWNDIHHDLQPGRGSVSVCVLAFLTVLIGTGGRELPAQERRSKPKIIIVHDNPRQDLSQMRAVCPPPGRRKSGVSGGVLALERPRESSLKAEDLKPSSPPESEFAQGSPPASPSAPPLLAMPSFAASKMQHPGPETRESSDKPEHLPGVDNPPRIGKLGEPISGPKPAVLNPINPLRSAPVAGRATGEKADHSNTVPVPSAARPVNFTTSELPEEEVGSRPLSAAASAAFQPFADKNTGTDTSVWRIAGVWVAIAFSMALSMLACSLVLLTVRQQLGGKHGSIIRVEFSQPGGGSLVLPFSLAPPTGESGGRETPLRCQTRVADFAEASFAAATLGPIFGEPGPEGEDQHREQDEAILQQILADNITLQKGVTSPARAAAG